MQLPLADNSLAILRVSNLAIGAMLKGTVWDNAAAPYELPRSQFAWAAE